jgi:hypothetical protein
MSELEKRSERKWQIKILKPDGEIVTIIKDYDVKQSSDEEELTFDDENKRKVSLSNKNNLKYFILFVILND